MEKKFYREVKQKQMNLIVFKMENIAALNGRKTNPSNFVKKKKIVEIEFHTIKFTP